MSYYVGMLVMWVWQMKTEVAVENQDILFDLQTWNLVNILISTRREKLQLLWAHYCHDLNIKCDLNATLVHHTEPSCHCEAMVCPMFPVISQYYFPPSSQTQSEKEIQQLSIPSPKEKKEEKVWKTKEPVSENQTSHSVVLLNMTMINLNWKLQMSHQIPTTAQMGWAGISKWKAFVLRMSAENMCLRAEKLSCNLKLVFAVKHKPICLSLSFPLSTGSAAPHPLTGRKRKRVGKNTNETGECAHLRGLLKGTNFRFSELL